MTDYGATQAKGKNTPSTTSTTDKEPSHIPQQINHSAVADKIISQKLYKNNDDSQLINYNYILQPRDNGLLGNYRRRLQDMNLGNCSNHQERFKKCNRFFPLNHDNNNFCQHNMDVRKNAFTACRCDEHHEPKPTNISFISHNHGMTSDASCQTSQLCLITCCPNCTGHDINREVRGRVSDIALVPKISVQTSPIQTISNFTSNKSKSLQNEMPQTTLLTMESATNTDNFTDVPKASICNNVCFTKINKDIGTKFNDSYNFNVNSNNTQNDDKHSIVDSESLEKIFQENFNQLSNRNANASENESRLKKHKHKKKHQEPGKLKTVPKSPPKDKNKIKSTGDKPKTGKSKKSPRKRTVGKKTAADRLKKAANKRTVSSESKQRKLSGEGSVTDLLCKDFLQIHKLLGDIESKRDFKQMKVLQRLSHDPGRMLNNDIDEVDSLLDRMYDFRDEKCAALDKSTAIYNAAKVNKTAHNNRNVNSHNHLDSQTNNNNILEVIWQSRKDAEEVKDMFYLIDNYRREKTLLFLIERNRIMEKKAELVSAQWNRNLKNLKNSREMQGMVQEKQEASVNTNVSKQPNQSSRRNSNETNMKSNRGNINTPFQLKKTGSVSKTEGRHDRSNDRKSEKMIDFACQYETVAHDQSNLEYIKQALEFYNIWAKPLELDDKLLEENYFKSLTEINADSKFDRQFEQMTLVSPNNNNCNEIRQIRPNSASHLFDAASNSVERLAISETKDSLNAATNYYSSSSEYEWKTIYRASKNSAL